MNKMTVKVGITGGIGSGKSTICQVFKTLGIPVFEADQMAKQLVNSNSEIKEKLIHLYGKEIYTSNDVVDRKKLANIIFNDDIELERVNSIVHPVVRNEFSKWLTYQKTDYIIHEAAILFESGFYKMMDFNILVTAPENERIERVSKRDRLSTAHVKERMKKQWTDEQKRKLADLELTNDNKSLLLPQIIKIDKQLKEHGKIW